jgi:hypothetical protein
MGSDEYYVDGKIGKSRKRSRIKRLQCGNMPESASNRLCSAIPEQCAYVTGAAWMLGVRGR